MKRIARWRDMIQIAKAMGITLRQGVIPSDVTKPTLSFRGRPVLRRDDQGRTPCIVCGTCVDECPMHCICVAKVEGESGVTVSIRFEVDWKRCIYCGICASVCPVEAIKLSEECGP